jgi:amino acid transporter
VRRLLSNFAFSFTIISVLTGVTTLYNTGLNYGGPVTMTFGWFVAGAFTMTVGLSMAEICSSFPTSGGLYYWSARLSGNRWAPFASWITGWYAYTQILSTKIRLLERLCVFFSGCDHAMCVGAGATSFSVSSLSCSMPWITGRRLANRFLFFCLLTLV